MSVKAAFRLLKRKVSPVKTWLSARALI